MAEENKKKTTTRKKKVEEKPVEQNNELTVDELRQMMQQMMATMNMFMQQQVVQQQQPKVEEVVEKEVKPKKQTKKTKWTKADLIEIENERIPVKSVIDNVGYTSKRTNIKYKWSNKGDIELMTVSEILGMETRSQRFLHTPWLVIEDERVVQALRLTELYDLIDKVDDVNKLLELSTDEIDRIFNKLPKEYKDNFKDEIYVKVKTRELKDLEIIDALSKILDIDLRNI